MGDDESDIRSARGRGRTCAAELTVSIAANNGAVGGGEVMLLQIARALIRLGVDTEAVVPAESEVAKTVEADGIRTVPLPARDRRTWMRALRVWDRTQRPGVLWCNGIVPSAATAGHARRIVHFHQRPEGVRRPVAVLARRGAYVTLVPSGSMREAFPRATVFPNWTASIDAAGHVPSGDGPFVIGFLGRHSPEKGVPVLADALRRLDLAEPGAYRLLLAGDPRFVSRRGCEDVERSLRPIAHLLDRPGWVDQVDFFPQVDLLVVPSVWQEAFALVAAEAMSAHVPTIVSDAGALPEVVGGAGRIVAAGDAGALATAIADVAHGHAGLSTEALFERWQVRFSPQAGERRVAGLLAYLGLRSADVCDQAEEVTDGSAEPPYETDLPT